VDEVDGLAGEGWRAGYGRVAVGAVTGAARFGLAPARLDVGGVRRRPDRRQQGEDDRDAEERRHAAQRW
jgi:hypothetical protein